jgi:hypothetical protein
LFTVRFCFLLLVVTSILFCQPDVRSVPSTWVKDDQLVVSNLNFSIQCPIPNCEWTYGQATAGGFNSSVFYAKNRNKPDDGAFVLFAMDTPSGGERMDTPNGMKSFLGHMQKSLPKGWQVAQDAVARSSAIPMPGSQMATTTLHQPGETRLLHGFYYFVQGRFSYVFCGYSAENAEPPEFTNFVRSFRLLDVSANAPEKQPADPATGFILLLAIGGAVVDWRYKRRGGLKPTRREYLCLGIAVLICVALILWMASIGRSPETLGHLTGFFLVVILGVWELGRWRIRKKNPV